MSDAKKPLRDLFPEIKPYDEGFLKVDDLHEIYYEQSGNKEGKPAIFLYVFYRQCISRLNNRL